MPEELAVNSRVVIPGSDLEFSFSRSGGPGGQKVNKTESRVQLSFDLEGTAALNAGVKARMRLAWRSRINREGRLVLACDSHRERSRNLAELRERLVSMIRSCLQPPRPRRATRPTLGSKRRRLESKRKHGQIKRMRGKVSDSD
jgi:ribosome-associated protein